MQGLSWGAFERWGNGEEGEGKTLEMELFAASLLMIGGLFPMTERVVGSSMRLMVRLSINWE